MDSRERCQRRSGQSRPRSRALWSRSVQDCRLWLARWARHWAAVQEKASRGACARAGVFPSSWECRKALASAWRWPSLWVWASATLSVSEMAVASALVSPSESELASPSAPASALVRGNRLVRARPLRTVALVPLVQALPVSESLRASPRSALVPLLAERWPRRLRSTRSRRAAVFSFRSSTAQARGARPRAPGR